MQPLGKNSEWTAEYASYTQHVEWMHKDVVLSLEHNHEPVLIQVVYKFPIAFIVV
jgi:hypothetical protein